MQVDYGEGAPTCVPGTDRYRKPRLFVATLRCSTRSFRRVVWKSSQETWARLHEQAWRYFHGSCRYMAFDLVAGNKIQEDVLATPRRYSNAARRPAHNVPAPRRSTRRT
jgi:transposase